MWTNYIAVNKEFALHFLIKCISCNRELTAEFLFHYSGFGWPAH